VLLLLLHACCLDQECIHGARDARLPLVSLWLLLLLLLRLLCAGWRLLLVRLLGARWMLLLLPGLLADWQHLWLLPVAARGCARATHTRRTGLIAGLAASSSTTACLTNGPSPRAGPRLKPGPAQPCASTCCSWLTLVAGLQDAELLLQLAPHSLLQQQLLPQRPWRRSSSSSC
jgi:hypothetical protein